MSALLELATRCEQAAGSDRELDETIHLSSDDLFADGALPAYTASLDAAMTLVPESIKTIEQSSTFLAAWDNGKGRWFHRVQMNGKGVWGEAERVATLPLALCAAALRTRAASEQQL